MTMRNAKTHPALANQIKPVTDIANGSFPRIGTIVIVDISGFTQLVYETELVTGRDIIQRLLTTIISANQLGLNIAEVEGDAVFFYRFGEAPSQQEILSQYEKMLHDFLESIFTIEELKRQPLSLSLKMVVHYGAMAQYHICGMNRLYGRVVTDAHLLLKNEVKSHSYVLMTDDYIQQMKVVVQEDHLISSKQCEILRGIRMICYSSFDYS